MTVFDFLFLFFFLWQGHTLLLFVLLFISQLNTTAGPHAHFTKKAKNMHIHEWINKHAHNYRTLKHKSLYQRQNPHTHKQIQDTTTTYNFLINSMFLQRGCCIQMCEPFSWRVKLYDYHIFLNAYIHISRKTKLHNCKLLWGFVLHVLLIDCIHSTPS